MSAKTEAAYRREFGRRVRVARMAQGLSQRELAERADIADKYLSRIEVGAAMPSVFVADNIARGLGVALDALTGKIGAARSAVASRPLHRAVRLLRGMNDAELARAVRVIVALAR